NLSEMFHDLVQLPDSNYLLGGRTPFITMKIDKNTGDSLWSYSNFGKIVSFDKTSSGNLIACDATALRLFNDTGGIVWTKTFSYLDFNWVRSTSDGGFITSGIYFV